MPKSLEQTLKDAGQTPEQIASILGTLGPARAIFETVVTSAEQLNADAATKLAAAEAKEKQINKFWNEEATPEINRTLSEKASAEARANFYRTQAEEAKKAGFIAADAPGFEDDKGGDRSGDRGGDGKDRNGRTQDGRFVKGDVPGSPAFMTMEQGMEALSEASYLMTEHQRLFGEPLPDLKELTVEAGRSRRKAREVWNDKYGVTKRREELAAAAKQKERDAIETEVRAKVAKEYADRFGNENTRPLVPSRFPNYAKDEKTGAPDKLAWTRTDKKERLRSRIREQVAKETGQTVQ